MGTKIANEKMQSKRICIVETWNVSPHLETSLEIALSHLQQGDDVYYYFLGQKLKFVELLVKECNNLKIIKKSPEKLGLSLIKNKKLFVNFGRCLKQIKLNKLPEFTTMDELKKFEYEGFKAGLSCASSLHSFLKTSEIHVQNYKDLIKRILESGVSVFNFCRKEFKNKKPDIIYLFNGRFCNTRAIFDASKNLCKKTLIHERGSNKNKYEVYDFFPHDMAKIQDKILASWETSNSKNKSIVGTQFFLNQRNKKESYWETFLKYQKSGYLPFQKNTKKRLISFFSSSDDEYAAVGDLANWGSWIDQKNAVQELIKVIANDLSINLIIRLHPHLAEKDKNDLLWWLNLKLPKNVSLILPSDPTDTYSLIEQSDVVLSVGSSVGIESVFWGTPSICLGPSLYAKLDAVYYPSNLNELKILLNNEKLSCNPLKALPFGYYFGTFGKNFKFYKAKTLFSGKFLGIDLQKEYLC